eukprot:Rmarinus@m.1336
MTKAIPELSVHKFFYRCGVFSYRYRMIILPSFFILFIGLMFGLLQAVIVTSDVWVEEGGRVERELNYIEDHIEANIGETFEATIYTTDPDGGNVLTPAHILAHLDTMAAVSEITVTTSYEGDEEFFDMMDVCKSGNPFLTQCSRVTVLDCFVEGSYNFPPEHTQLLGVAEATARLVEETGYDGIVVTSYNWCYYVHLMNLQPDISFSPTQFGDCRPFLKDPYVAGSQGEEGYVQYKVLQDAYEEATSFIVVLRAYCLEVEGSNFIACMQNTTRQAEAAMLSEEEYQAYLDSVDAATKDFTIATVSGDSYLTYEWPGYFVADTDDQVAYYVSKGCQYWDGGAEGLDILPEMQMDLVIGGGEIDETGNYTSVEAYQGVYLLWQRKALQKLWQLPPGPENAYRARGKVYDEDFIQDVLDEFKDRFVEETRRRHPETEGRSHGFSSKSLNDAVSEYSQASALRMIFGFVLMALYAMFTLQSTVIVPTGVMPVTTDPENNDKPVAIQGRLCFKKDSRACVGIFGILIVMIAVLGAQGLAALIGIEFNATTTQVLPFLLLGLGVDDMFIVTRLFQYDRSIYASDEAAAGTLMANVGPSITLTSVTNAFSFFIATLIPIPLVRSFALQAGMSISLTYVGVLLTLPACLTLEASWSHDRAERAVANGQGAFVIPFLRARNVPEKNPKVNPWDRESGVARYMVRYLHRWHIPFVTNNACMLLVLLSSFTVVGISIWRYSVIEMGIFPRDVLPKGTEDYDFVAMNDKYFNFFGCSLVTEDIDYGMMQPHMWDTYFRAVETNHAVQDVIWLEGFYSWARPCFAQSPYGVEGVSEPYPWYDEDTNTYDYDILQQYCPEEYFNSKCHPNHPSTRGMCGPMVGCVAYPPEEQSSFAGVLDDMEHVLPLAMDPSNLTACVDLWIKLDKQQLAYNHGLQRDDSYNLIAPIEISFMRFFEGGLNEATEFVDVIHDVRDVCDVHKDAGLDIFPVGVPFVLWEQYITIRELLAQCIGLALCAGFIAGAVFFTVSSETQSNPTPRDRLMRMGRGCVYSFIMCVSTLKVVVEVAGFMEIADLKLSAIPGVSLIMTTGFSVEFSAHLIVAFANTKGTQTERLVAALDHLFVPTLDGASSTFCGIVMMSTSQFTYVRKYYFVLYLLILLWGLVTGLFFTPVVLLLFAPRNPLTPTPGSMHKVAPADHIEEAKDVATHPTGANGKTDEDGRVQEVAKM